MDWSEGYPFLASDSQTSRWVERCEHSWFDVLALGVLLSLIVDRGCVPNAKPLLDYSALFARL